MWIYHLLPHFSWHALYVTVVALLGRFIAVKDANIRYLGLEAMTRLARSDGPKKAQVPYTLSNWCVTSSLPTPLIHAPISCFTDTTTLSLHLPIIWHPYILTCHGNEALYVSLHKQGFWSKVLQLLRMSVQLLAWFIYHTVNPPCAVTPPPQIFGNLLSTSCSRSLLDLYWPPSSLLGPLMPCTFVQFSTLLFFFVIIFHNKIQFNAGPPRICAWESERRRYFS